MYQAPPSYDGSSSAPDKHISTSSSVYSPIESEYGFNKNARNDIIEEEEELDYTDKQSTFSSNGSFETSRSRTPSNMMPDISNQTFQTYTTAHSGSQSNPSFTSINESILRNNSTINLDDNDHSNNTNREYDDDITPKLPNTATYVNDGLDDKTPIIGENEVFGYGPNLSVPNANNGNGSVKRLSSQLPQQELSNKFQRLSVTLQQTNMTTSGDSYVFMNSFQQNVEKVNKNQSNTSATRTSFYYNKISETNYDEDEPEENYAEKAETTVVSHDQASEVSTVSNRSSIISQDSGFGFERASGYKNKLESIDRFKSGQGDEIRSMSTSSSSFIFGDNQQQNASVDNINRSSYNIRGSRVSPLKIVKKTSAQSINDVPIRKDLVYKFEQLSANDSNKNISEKEKNEYFIASKNMTMNQNLSNKYLNGLNISITDSVLDPKNKSMHQEQSEVEYSREINEVSEADRTAVDSIHESAASNFSGEEDEDLSSLFIRALHPFDSSTLQSASDASICLSFEKDDLAFVHTIDDSGWGEVTLVDSLQRGWIPMNYFTIAVVDDDKASMDDEENNGKIPNSVYLKPLFHACGKFLMNPLSRRNRHGRYTFSIRVINSIRDGVRLLLQETDCLSRSNEIVTKRPVVRKTRKSLLADWYNLMLKANEYKGTSNFNKIEILTLMVYQVTRKATSFLQVWSVESKKIIKRENEKRLQNDMNNYPLLSIPPLAKQRVTEINGILYSYLGLIIGRLDLIEHNSAGCDILETITHQIILLLRELLFISKTGSDFSSKKPADLDGALDTLLSLVSELVSGVKNLAVKTLNESEEDWKYSVNQSNSPTKDYYYTQEGGDLIQVAAKMIRSISTTIASIRKLLEITGDFKLNAERSYPDYSKMKIEPDEFIKKCSIGIAKAQSMKNRDLKALRPKVNHASNRYSMMRSGKTGALKLTPSGAHLLHDSILADADDSSPFSISNPEFEPFTTTANSTKENESNNINNELLVDSNGNLLGASFKGLVYTLTNENSPPEYFFVSTFFICFRSFANGIDLIEELITRFDIQNRSLAYMDKNDISSEIKLKNRRRLIVKMFQLWLESYWDHESDYSLLTTLINLFNEGISIHLPLDAMKLIGIAAKLSSKPLIENQNPKRKPQKNSNQLVNRSITITKLKRKNSISNSSLSSRYSMVDGYELSKINTNSSTSSSLKSISLPLPLGVGNQTSSSNSLLTKNQLTTIEKVNLTYRAILGNNWCAAKYISTKYFVPLDLSSILPNWYNICDQSWVLSNYRPNLLDFNGLELAKQLTIIESHMFCSVKPDELLSENFTAKRAHLKLAPNIRQSLLFTNCLSGYVLESILQPKINQKMRVNMVKTWLKVAISCLYLRNFNSLAAVITSLQSHLITRLTRVWADLSEKYRELYEYLSGIIHPEKNYNVYRSKLRNFLVSNDYNIPIVPYFSLFLQDLTFVSEGNSNYRKANTFLNQKLINIDKYLKITRIIADIESLQTPYVNSSTILHKENKRNSLSFLGNYKSSSPEDYHIIPVPQLQELVLLELWKVCQLNRAEEDRAWKLSCLIQPRDAT